MALPFIFPRSSPFAFPGRPPAFDPGHPAAQKCIASVIPSGANLINLAPMRVGTVVGTVTASVLSQGPAIVNTTSSSYVTVPSGPRISGGPYIFAAIFQLDAITANNQLIVADNTGGLNQFLVQGTSGLLSLGMSSTLTLGLALSTGIPYFCAACAIGGVGYAVVVRRLTSGRVTTSSGTTAFTWSASTSTVLNFSGGPTVNRFIDGKLFAAMTGNSFLSVPQLLAWSADPWSFWYPHRTIIPLHGLFRVPFSKGYALSS